jgi:glycine oxidase
LPNRAEQADVIVAGGGVIGLACAWRAAQRGMRVRVLERDRVGAGASGVAAGMLAPVGEATWGEERLLGMALASHRAWPRFAEDLREASGTDVGYLAFGALHVALDSDEGAELRRRYELMRELGLEAEWLRPSEARELEPGLTPRLHSAVHARHECGADPRALVAALRLAAQREGAEVVEGAEVMEALIGERGVEGLRTADGAAHRAAAVVCATGSFSGRGGWLPAHAAPPVRPVEGEILTLRGRSAPIGRIVASERVYAVPRPDGRVVVGATVEERGFDVTVTAGGVLELLREGYRAIPELAELELTETQAGLRPGTPDNLPVIGPSAVAGLLLATGHFRNGILLAPVTADAVVAMLLGEAPPPEMAAADPSRFASRPSPEEVTAR